MRGKYHYILNDTKKRYNLDAKVTNDRYIYIRIQKGIPGLK